MNVDRSKHKKIVLHLFQVIILLLCLSFVIVMFMYAEYWYVRASNPNIKIPGMAGEITRNIDNKMGIDWQFTLDKDGQPTGQIKDAVTKEIGKAPEFVGITEWYQRDPSTIPNNEHNMPAHFSHPVTLVENIGKRATLLAFGRLDCSYCLNIYPYLGEYKRKYGDMLKVIALQSPKYEDEKDWPKIVKELDERSVMFDVGLDVNKETSSAYKVEFVPTIFLINKEGNIIFSKVGEGDFSDLDQAISELLQNP